MSRYFVPAEDPVLPPWLNWIVTYVVGLPLLFVIALCVVLSMLSAARGIPASGVDPGKAAAPAAVISPAPVAASTPRVPASRSILHHARHR